MEISRQLAAVLSETIADIEANSFSYLVRDHLVSLDILYLIPRHNNRRKKNQRPSKLSSRPLPTPRFPFRAFGIQKAFGMKHKKVFFKIRIGFLIVGVI